MERPDFEEIIEDAPIAGGFLIISTDNWLILRNYITALEAKNAALRDELDSLQRDIDHLVNSRYQD